MKSLIIYFSLFGSTKKMAQQIHRGISPLAEQCDIVPIKQVDIRRLPDYDLIGIGSPVWAQGIPLNVRLFLYTMPFLYRKHAFAFCTHGAAPGKYVPLASRYLASRGLTVIGGRDWYGSLGLAVSPSPYLTDGHPDEIDLREAEEFGKEMAEISRRISAGESKLIPPLPEMPGVVFGEGPPRDRPTLNKEKCRYPRCHLCMDNCPMDAINLSVSPPVFAQGNCRPCYYCEMICPAGAIDVIYQPWAEYELWHVKNIFAKNLEKDEAAGHFRRLVPADKVGWDTPYYKVHNKHPRYKIPKE